jgi:capsular polysaccharide transport system permease protein
VFNEEAVTRNVQSGFISCALINLRVFKALLLREVITRYGRHNIGFLWLMVEPMLFTLGVTALWSATHHIHTYQLPIVGFAITGYSSVLLWRNVSNRCVNAVSANLALLFHRNVKLLDLFMARIFLEIAGATTSFVFLTSLFAGLEFGGLHWPIDPLKTLCAWLLLAWFSTALGLAVGALSERTEFMDRTWHVFTYLLFPLSGAAFLVDWLPPSAQSFALFIPMVHATEMLRDGFFGSIVRTHYDVMYLVGCNGVLTLAGLVLMRESSKRVQML